MSDRISPALEYLELAKSLTIRKFRVVQDKGAWRVRREVVHYILQMIMANDKKLKILVTAMKLGYLTSTFSIVSFSSGLLANTTIIVFPPVIMLSEVKSASPSFHVEEVKIFPDVFSIVISMMVLSSNILRVASRSFTVSGVS